MTDEPTQKMDAVTTSGSDVPASPVLGSEGDVCRTCAAPLATDQRYCLSCGTRRGAQRLPFAELMGDPRHRPIGPGQGHVPVPALAAPPSDRGPLVLLAGLVALLLALGIGVLLGRGGDDDGKPVINVGTPTTATGTTTAPAAGGTATVASDWPAGTEGWTLQLQTLPAASDQAAVDAAKADATGKGAASVGAVRSDEYPTLPAGQIVVYSGTYTSQADAQNALPSVSANFPAAAVVQVAKSAAPAAPPATPTVPTVPTTSTPKTTKTTSTPGAATQTPKSTEDAIEKSKKIPDTVQGGKELPKDDGEDLDTSGAESIG